jgi:hypothetical protein
MRQPKFPRSGNDKSTAIFRVIFTKITVGEVLRSLLMKRSKRAVFQPLYADSRNCL